MSNTPPLTMWFIGYDNTTSRPGHPMQTLAKAQALGYDLITTPLTTSVFNARVIDTASRYLSDTTDDVATSRPSLLISPLTPDDTDLTPGDNNTGFVVRTSAWLDLGSADPVIAHVSQQVFNLEVAYASFCGIQHVLVSGPVPGSDEVQYARALLEALSMSSHLQFFVLLPMSGELEDAGGDEQHLAELARESYTLNDHEAAPEGDELDDVDVDSSLNTWDTWDGIRTMCDYNSRLSVALELPRKLAHQFIQDRWYSEPVRGLVLPRTTFIRNTAGFPVLAKPHQDYLNRLMRLRLPPCILLNDVGTLKPAVSLGTATEPTPAEAAKHIVEKPTAQLQYVRHLQQSQPPLPIIERFGQGYQDYMQSPLQPLADNLESITYEVFEKDPIKYDWYQRAIALALTDLAETLGPDTEIIVAVVGAGRGPLVSKAILASQSSGAKARFWAVEKNPNAYVHLQRRNLTDPLWDKQVTVTKTDMRAWKGPVIDGEVRKVHILVSELLGSFADNELSPECLDGVQHVLEPEYGINIPRSYTAHATPIATPRLHTDLIGRAGADKWEIPYVVMLQQYHFLATLDDVRTPDVQCAWRFSHPVPSAVLAQAEARKGGSAEQGGAGGTVGGDGGNEHNSRYCKLKFTCQSRGTCHGLAGYFETILYTGKAGEKVELSTNPVTMEAKSKDMISWFPIFFPLKTPMQIPDGAEMDVSLWRQTDDRKVCYTGGRDGVICAWDLHLDLKNSAEPASNYKPEPTTHRSQVQAHTHWINDIALAQSNQALVSASSDITVKVWRPSSSDRQPPQSIGLHSDYVKTLAVPSLTSDWVASGGLDRKICLWDLGGAGQKLCINVGDDEAGSLSSKEKGSVYALAATNNVLCSGGPESTVRVWDSRTGKRITKLVGHTDNIRDVLVSQDGSTILTASSDRTVKVWSTIAGRCMYTLTMHDVSVWSLFSEDPDLSVFYSSDKNGLIAKTDTRGAIELDEGLSVAVCQEHEGVHKVKAAGAYLWTATSRPSISRWRDVDTENAEIDVPENYSYSAHRSSATPTITRYPSPPARTGSGSKVNGTEKKIPLKHMLRLSNTVDFPMPITVDSEDTDTAPGARRGTLERSSIDVVVPQPVRGQPDYSVVGQNGLIKHVMLNDRKRVLTLDTASEVVMWDLLKCVPIKSFGKRHLEDVKDEVNTTTTTSVANWCTVDTRTGSVAIVLEENNCFDAEMYADELDLDEDIEFREDQRINLGKWVLRYLFSNLITEEIRRDQAFRKQLLAGDLAQQGLQREGAPSSIQMPQAQSNGWHPDATGPVSSSTVKPTNGFPHTPGVGGIAAATPGGLGLTQTRSTASATTGSAAGDDGAATSQNPARTSQEGHADYFSRAQPPSSTSEITAQPSLVKPPATPAAEDEATTDGAATPTKDTPSKEGLFGKKFRMNMSFAAGMKKMNMPSLGANKTSTTDKPAAVATETAKEDAETDSHSSTSHRTTDENLLGTVQRIRWAYEDSLQSQVNSNAASENGLPVARRSIDLPSLITPSLPAETPVLKPPLNTTILIQEDRPEAGGVADLFEGSVGSLSSSIDIIERVAPMWLGEVLLRNTVPAKDIVKISFVLEPREAKDGGAKMLPSIAADGNNRLNANRMLRAKKILAYVAERIEPGKQVPEGNEGSGKGELRPEEYLELWCNGQIIPPNMTLATIRSSIWRGGGDVLLHYRSNGKREILHVAPPAPAAPAPA
ncbi:hypothetical protein B0A48_09828 [Cryoendolithus antarcticus]|uniref:Uncharacterized protein n=1 Tax=Cryoendolithus antarcticus TaxID=1507870 RepID=A0A1V8T351_9PEZI|nr:hypothetical protein B0A48_09828 [Cryoendolithus antarcticus]